MSRTLQGLAVVLVLAACVGGDRGGTTTSIGADRSTTTTVAFDDEGARRFRECLALRGIGIPPIETDGTGRPRLDFAIEDLDLGDPEVSDAVADCSSELGAGALDLSGDEMLRAVVVRQLALFAACMREKGIEDFPDPEPGFSGVGPPFAVAEIPYSNPALGAVAAVCGERLLTEDTIP